MKNLYDLDGSLYMGRWSIINEGTWAGRLLEKLTGFASVRLHWIRRADHDRDLHNHPFSYRSLILKGWYTEEYDEPTGVGDDARFIGLRTVKAGEWAEGHADKFHRIAAMPKKGVWTLFFMSKNTGVWGFNRGMEFIPSKEYFLQLGYHADGKGPA